MHLLHLLLQAALSTASKEKGAMVRALRIAEATLRELVTLTLRQDLDPIQRTSLETCITVQLHLKEVRLVGGGPGNASPCGSGVWR